MSFTFDQVILEFVRNSYNAFYSIEPRKDWHPEFCEIEIDIDNRDGVISIRDNGPGFSNFDLKYLLGRFSASTFREKKGIKHEIKTYGLGVVSAASWLGDIWEITTKRDAENYIQKLSVNASTFFEDEVSSEINIKKIPWKDANTQFTEVKIQLNKLRKPLWGKTIIITKDRIIRLLGILNHNNPRKIMVKYKGEFLESREPIFSFSYPFTVNINDVDVHGEIRVLDPHPSNRSQYRHWSGIFVFQNGEYIQTEAFSQVLDRSGSNRRRICCFIHLDSLESNLWKNDFIWDKFRKEELIEAILHHPDVKLSFHLSKMKVNRFPPPPTNYD